jgi:hypothetical protein
MPMEDVWPENRFRVPADAEQLFPTLFAQPLGRKTGAVVTGCCVSLLLHDLGY